MQAGSPIAAARLSIVLCVASAACATGPSARPAPPARAPAPPAPVASPPAPPALAAPWRDLDYRATDEAIARHFAATRAADCAQGTYKANGVCWDSDGRTGDQIITLYFDTPEQGRRFTQPWGTSVFAGVDDDETWRTWHLPAGTRRIAATLTEAPAGTTVKLEELMPLRAAIPWMQSLLGLSHDAVTRKLGKRVYHAPRCAGILCWYALPPNEGGEVLASIEFADGAATRTSYVTWCGDDCAMGAAILAAFDTAFGKRTTVTRPYEESGELWTYHSYATTPGLVIQARERLPDRMFVCVGACD